MTEGTLNKSERAPVHPAYALASLSSLNGAYGIASLLRLAITRTGHILSLIHI